jgi:hypothetical protein
MCDRPPTVLSPKGPGRTTRDLCVISAEADDEAINSVTKPRDVVDMFLNDGEASCEPTEVVGFLWFIMVVVCFLRRLGFRSNFPFLDEK